MRKVLILAISIILLKIVSMQQIFAQCAMCKGTAEKSLEASSTAAVGLNIGILYLLAMPYLIIIIGGIYWYKKFYKKQSI